MWDDSTRWQHKCRNCGADATTAFCGSCGQKVEVKRLSLATLLHEIPHSIFHVDRGFFPTIVGLFTRPSDVVGEYLGGKRAKYFNPLTLLVICGSVCAALWTIFPFRPELFWGGLVPPKDDTLSQLLSYWFRLVGLTQILWLPLMGQWLYVTYRTARQYRLQKKMVEETILLRNTQHAADLENVSGTLKRARFNTRHFLWRLWRRVTGFMYTSRSARRAVASLPSQYVYGEFIVMAAFMTCASLLISAAASPLVYLADSSLGYKIGLASAAAAAAVPVFQLLMTAPQDTRPSAAAAIIASAYFVIGTPFGFLIMVWLMSLS
jgi:hypothetical protein